MGAPCYIGSTQACTVAERVPPPCARLATPCTSTLLSHARASKDIYPAYGGTCGFGNRGQKARSGPGTRTGFEGGQMPLYRRLPKLKGICGAHDSSSSPHAGMGAGQPDFVVLNLDKLEGRFEQGEEVTMEKLKEKGFVRASGRRRNLPLKVLGDGELKTGLCIKAGAFSASAKAKIEAAGGQAEVVAPRRKWTKAGHKKQVEALKAAGKDYAVEKRKRRAEACQRKASPLLKMRMTDVLDFQKGQATPMQGPGSAPKGQECFVTNHQNTLSFGGMSSAVSRAWKERNELNR
eukprot:scaffold46349_cov19-Tisochrysis_lutea.AAC.1